MSRAPARRWPPPDDDFALAWARFVEDYRRSRAPEGLRERVVAAVEAAARAGSWQELSEAPGAAGPPPPPHRRGGER